MRSESERPNVFAGPHVDRLKFAQADGATVARWIAEGSARLVPVWKSRCPLIRGPSPSACLLPVGSGPLAGIGTDDMILLGEYRGLAVFTTEIEAEAPPPLDGGAEFADLRLAASLLPHDEAGLVAYARAMISFRHRHRFCGSCGAPTRPERNGRVMTCTSEACRTEFYPRVDPAVIVLVTHGDRVLLGRQPEWPAGRYSTIAGFVEPGESLEDAVRREVLEETGIEAGAMSYQSSQPWPFPRSLMLGFRAEARTTDVKFGDAELEDARWFGRAELATGSMLPFPQSIAFRLVEEWYDAGAARPLAAEAGVHGWKRRR
ncbi:MAG TPA: NAD(+) diphosphatase [Steroidobacteraceae bacterium]|nr:NAD(+) diphosphatase [Steroidobacteraceae bacterium]